MNTRKTQVKDKTKTGPTPVESPVERTKKVCSICGKEFFGQGFGGHMWNQHQTKVGPKAELKQLKSELEVALKQLEDLKKNSVPKDKIYACPKCNSGIRGFDFKAVA